MANKRDISGVRTAQDLERKLGIADIKKATEQARIGITKTNQTLNDFINTSLDEFLKLQDKIDDKAEIWFGAGVPSISNHPASEWAQEEYQSHIGDLYYDRDTGYTYGFSEDNGYYGWTRIKDQDLTVALALAEAAKDTADDKRRVFIERPNPPYDEGDLWFNDNSEIYICQRAKGDGKQYEETDFIIATDYTERINNVDGKVVVLQGDVANISGRLTAAEADIDKIETEDLTAIEANIGNLQTENANVKARLTAAEADLSIVNSDVADISTLMFGSATGDSLQTEFSNAVVALISDAAIDSAKIHSLIADKITSGQINTNKVTVNSENGKLNITGETILIKDSNRTRVQIGKDANDDYNIYILDANGNIMFDATGIHSDAIKSPIIVDDMVSDNANISAGKINIDSLFSKINGSTNTIKATQIVVDDEGQKLSVAFNNIKKDISDADKNITSQGTQLQVIQGNIESKIWQQDIKKATDPLAKTTEEMNTKYSDLVQTIDGFKMEVSSTYSAKTETLATVKFMYVQTDSPDIKPTEGWQEAYPAWVDGKYIWQKAISVKGNGKETEIAVTCLTGAKGATGPQGEAGESGATGPQGPQGEAGKSQYFHIKYSDVANPTAEQMKEEPSTYIGTYVSDTQEDPTDPNLYTWARLEGIQGPEGIPGNDGNDGQTQYLHIAYSNSADGTTDFSVSVSEGKLYIGTYVDFTAADSTEPSDYTWTKIKGEQGIGISERKTQYYLSTSDEECTNGTWTDAMPAWETEKYLWIKDVITWSDDSVTETYPILADSINSANELANNAQKSTEENLKSMKSKIDHTQGYILQTVEESYYSKADEGDSLKELIKNEASTEIKQTTENITLNISSLQTAVNKIGESIEKQNTYFTFGSDGMTIGKSGAPIVAVHTNTGLEFRHKDFQLPIAKFTNEVLDVKNTDIENELKLHGKWAIREGKGYNLNIIWLG